MPANCLLSRNTNWKTNAGKAYTLTTGAGYEWVNKNFQPVERLRPVEFLRDWGLNLISAPATEQLPYLNLQLADDKNNSLQYQFSSYTRSDGYKGFRNIINHNQNIKGWQLHDVFNITNITMPMDKGFYLRPTIDIK